jgi:hypothetical protein
MSAASLLGGECRPTAQGLCVTSTPLPRISIGSWIGLTPTRLPRHLILPAATRTATGPRNVCASGDARRAGRGARGRDGCATGPTRCSLAGSRVPAEGAADESLPEPSGQPSLRLRWRRRKRVSAALARQETGPGRALGRQGASRASPLAAGGPCTPSAAGGRSAAHTSPARRLPCRFIWAGSSTRRTQ